jgi:hypothetical protein
MIHLLNGAAVKSSPFFIIKKVPAKFDYAFLYNIFDN